MCILYDTVFYTFYYVSYNFNSIYRYFACDTFWSYFKHCTRKYERICNGYCIWRIFQTILFIFLIISGLIIIVFGSYLKILILLGLLMIYKFIPNHKVDFKSQILGAVFGAVAFNFISLIFSKYLLIFRNFSFIYGKLTSLMLIMMWVYASFYIIFLGAEINKIDYFRMEKLLKKY